MSDSIKKYNEEEANARMNNIGRNGNNGEHYSEPNHYNNDKGSLYQFAEHHKLNTYEFDAIKRIMRCRKKGNFIEDIDKTIFLLELYKKEMV